MKKILLFGASGRVGLRLVEYALAEKHKVTAFVRNANKIKITNPNLEIISGDVFNKELVENAIIGQDVIVSSLGGRSTSPDYSVLSVGMEHILLGMSKHNVKRILTVVGAGILDDPQYGLRRNRPTYPEFFKYVSGKNWKVYESLKKSSTNWTMVCAPEMPSGERTEVYRTETDFLPDGGNRISVEDVADFILQNLDKERSFKKRIGIAY